MDPIQGTSPTPTPPHPQLDQTKFTGNGDGALIIWKPGYVASVTENRAEEVELREAKST